mgnify:CR=1 FL=1
MTQTVGGATGLGAPVAGLTAQAGAAVSSVGANIAAGVGNAQANDVALSAIDGNAVLRLAEVFGIAEASRILNRESGLLGLAGASDMRALHGAGTPEAAFAVDHFCYWAIRHAGSLIAAMGGVDALCFTGGIGENDSKVRGRILQGLDFMGLTPDHAKAILAAGADCVTLGDHAFDQKDMLSFIETEPRIIRPINFSKVAPGKGWRVFSATQGRKVLVAQVLGQVPRPELHRSDKLHLI